MRLAPQGIRSTPTSDGKIILDIHHGKMFSINAVGSKILELLEAGWNEELIAGEISRIYGMSIEVTRPDVCEFIEALRTHHIVEAEAASESVHRDAR
jgi:Coenzyme PQQ synthesis protein D (PqqD)